MNLPVWCVVSSGRGILKVIKASAENAISATPIFGSRDEAEEFINRRQDRLKGFIADEIPNKAEFEIFWELLVKGDINYVTIIESGGRCQHITANQARNRIRWSRPL